MGISFIVVAAAAAAAAAAVAAAAAAELTPDPYPLSLLFPKAAAGHYRELLASANSETRQLQLELARVQEALEQERHKLAVVWAAQEGEEAALQDEVTALTRRNNEMQLLLTTAEQDQRQAAEEREVAESSMEEERVGWQLIQQQLTQEVGQLRTQLQLQEEQVNSLERR